MFDYHIHSRVSFDSEESPENIIKTAKDRGLSEICFTDHFDYTNDKNGPHQLFSYEDYMKNYRDLRSDGIKIRRGVEFGLTDWNAPELAAFASEFDPDFIIGSVHFVEGYDPYDAEYWQDGKDPYEKYLLGVLKCVSAHDGYDVLGHLNYVCKSRHNKEKRSFLYSDYSDLCDEIMKTLVARGKGMEINTSGVDRIGEPLPSEIFIKRFSELGGKIVTIGSDAHTADRVGQYSKEALSILKNTFGYVCTFEKRKPIFHKL